MPKWSWLDKLIGGGKTTISIISIDLSYKIIFRTLYAPYFFYAPEIDCEEPNVEHEPELEKPQFSDLVTEYKEILANVGKLLASYAAKVDSDPEPTILIEPDIVDKPEPEVIDKPKVGASWCHCKKRCPHSPQKLKSFLLILLWNFKWNLLGS